MTTIPILIIDDNEADRYLLSRQLKETQLDVTIIEKDDGETAMTFFKAHEENLKMYPGEYPPVLIFLDINMPLMNGLEFLEQFSRLRKTIDIDTCVVMMISTSEIQSDKDRISSFEFVKDYIVKGTYTPQELKDKISACI